MAEQDPPWLKTARSFIGTQETGGAGDNPIIMKWPGEIAAKFSGVPGMTSYCALYHHDEIAWCGLFAGVCVAMSSIQPVFGPTETDKFLWAQAWKQFGIALDAPRLGCIVVFARHVGFFVGEQDGSYRILGGNQSDGVNIKTFDKDAVEALRWPGQTVAPPMPTRGSASTADQRARMGEAILDSEARRDSQGRLMVYDLPAGDGGGAYEVAGINERYHPTEAAQLASLIRSGRYDEAETYAIDYMVTYTDVVAGWSADAGVEFYLRDCAFNRGPTGAARIFQRALGVDEDGEVGPITLGAAAHMPAAECLTRLRAARESYERDPVGRDESSQFWRGLVNRWNSALATARKFSAEAMEEPIIIPPQKPTGKPMPQAPTPFNQKVDDCLVELAEVQRPVLEKYLKGLSEQSGDDFRAELIRMLGGTPPARMALPKPDAQIETDTSASSDSSAQTTPTTGSNVATNAGVGIAGILASLGLSGAGVIGMPIGPDASMTGLLLPIGIGIASALGLPAPIASMLGSLIQAGGKKMFGGK